MLKLLLHYWRKRNPIKYARYLGVKVGVNCRFIGMPNFGSEPYLISIGDHVEISNDVQFITHDGGTWVFRDLPEYKGVLTFKRIHIEDNVFIGCHSIILGGVHIGANCVIGAGSIVTKDIPENSVVCGVPARIVNNTLDYANKLKMENPKYDVELYRKNKKQAVLEMTEKMSLSPPAKTKNPLSR